jgi:TolB-like protein
MSDVASTPRETNGAIVRAQLQRILAAKAFSDSPNASRFLSYVVEQTLQGRGQNLKEYTIGVEVFERGESFDPRVDTVVRVEASRVRKRLADYYGSDRRDDAVRIDLPRGGYTPVFTKRAPNPVPFRNWKKFLIASGLVLAAVASVWIIRTVVNRAIANRLPLVLSVAVLPFNNVGGDAHDRVLCDGVLETLTTRLSEQEQLQTSFWVVDAADIRESGIHSPAEALRTFGVNLAVTGSIQRPKDMVGITVNLIDTRTRKHLGAKTILLRNAEFNALEDEVEAAVIGMLKLQIPPSRRTGLVARNTSEPGAEDFYLQGRGYLQRGPESAQNAASLFQKAVDRDRNYVLAYTALGEAYLQCMNPQRNEIGSTRQKRTSK